jgi:hypothetical protein
VSSDDSTKKLPSDDVVEQVRELNIPLYLMDKRLQELQAQLRKEVAEQVGELDKKVDKQRYNTQPIFNNQFADLRQDMDTRFKNIEDMIQVLMGDVQVLMGDILRLRTGHSSLEKRVKELGTKLEE